MARMKYRPSAQRRGFQAQQLSTAGISRMREESDRLIAGMRQRNQAEDRQDERVRRAMESDQAYIERMTRENNAIKIANLKIEAEREVGNIKAKIAQTNIDNKAVMDALTSVAEFSSTASKVIASRTAEQIKNLQPEETSIEDDLKARRAEAEGAVTVDALITEDQIRSNEDIRTAIRSNVTNPGRLGPVSRAQIDTNYFAQTPIYRKKLLQQEFEAPNGQKFLGAEIANNPELVNPFYRALRDQVVEASGLQSKHLKKTLNLIESMRVADMESALDESYKQDKALLVYQTETLFRTGDHLNIANGFSGAKALGNAATLDIFDKIIADPNTDPKVREAILNFVVPMEGNTKPYVESHYLPRVKPALDELRKNEAKAINDELKIRKAEATNWTLQHSDTIQTTIDDTGTVQELEEREVELREAFQKMFPGVEFPASITSRFSTAKKGNAVYIRNETDRKYRNKTMDSPYVNSIRNASEKSYAKELLEKQQVELYGEGYKPLMANIDSLAKKNADFSSNIAGDTNGRVEAVRAKMLAFVADPDHPFSLPNTEDANVTNQALTNYVANAAITDGSNGDPLNPFRYKEGERGREYIEIGVPDPNLQQHLNWVRGKMEASATLGDLIQNNPTIMPYSGIKMVSKAQESGEPIVFDDTVYYLSRQYKKKPTEIYNAIVQRRNEVMGTNDPFVTPNDFTELQDNASPEWNKLISSGNYDQVRRAGAQAASQLQRQPMPVRGSMQRAYTSGNIGPTSTGPHLDVKRVDGGRFEPDALDGYVVVNDPEFGQVSLGQIRELTNNVGDNFDEHVARGSHGIDYGLQSGTEVFVTNGAKVVSSQPTEHGDYVIIELPNGDQYSFLHGKR